MSSCAGLACGFVVAAIVAALGAPAADAAGWSAAQTLVRPASLDDFRIDGAGNAAGDEAFAWMETTTLRRDPHGMSGRVGSVRARARSADGTLGPIRTVSRTDAIVDRPLVGLDRRGTTTVSWQEFRRGRLKPFVMVAVAPRGGRFGRPLQLGRGSGYDNNGLVFVGPADLPSPLAVAPDGSAVLAWNDGRRIVAARRPAAPCAPGRKRACFGTPKGLGGGGAPAVAIGSDGTAAVTWALGGVAVATARPGRPWRAPRRVSPVGEPASRPAVAVDADGGAVVAWRRADDDSHVEPHAGPVVTATRAANGGVSAPQIVDPGFEFAVAVAVNAQGEALLRWVGQDGVLAAVRPPGGVFGAPIVLDAGLVGPAGSVHPKPLDMSYRQMAVDGHGRAVLAFGSQASVRPALGDFAAPQPMPGGRQLVAAGDKVTTLWVAGGGAVAVSDLPS